MQAHHPGASPGRSRARTRDPGAMCASARRLHGGAGAASLRLTHFDSYTVPHGAQTKRAGYSDQQADGSRSCDHAEWSEMKHLICYKLICIDFGLVNRGTSIMNNARARRAFFFCLCELAFHIRHAVAIFGPPEGCSRESPIPARPGPATTTAHAARAVNS